MKRTRGIDPLTGELLPPHQQVRITHPLTGARIAVDKRIAALLKALWRMDIGTVNSCEDNNPAGYMWIEFVTSLDAERFLNAALPRQDGMYSRANEWDEPQQWLYKVNIFDAAIDQPGARDFWCSISIRFPVTDYPAILHNVKEFSAMG